jgi:hypothetical protein
MKAFGKGFLELVHKKGAELSGWPQFAEDCTMFTVPTVEDLHKRRIGRDWACRATVLSRRLGFLKAFANLKKKGVLRARSPLSLGFNSHPQLFYRTLWF